jgi:hypothetical protein
MTPSARFNTPDQGFADAKASHGEDNPFMRMGTYVPTRDEVATLPIDDLAFILDLWMYEGPTELIPSYQQIREVRSVLESRADADTAEARAVIAECDRYLAEEK